jgi:hypothetical protein
MPDLPAWTDRITLREASPDDRISSTLLISDQGEPDDDPDTVQVLAIHSEGDHDHILALDHSSDLVAIIERDTNDGTAVIREIGEDISFGVVRDVVTETGCHESDLLSGSTGIRDHLDQLLARSRNHAGPLPDAELISPRIIRLHDPNGWVDVTVKLTDHGPEPCPECATTTISRDVHIDLSEGLHPERRRCPGCGWTGILQRH